MMPWLDNDEWFAAYAAGVAKIKRGPAGPPPRAAVEAAFTRVYRAVAFDIDGTLTRPGEPHVDERMARVVERLLERGVPVLLITGRGTTVKDAAEEIRTRSDLSDWYFRRLYCVNHNGVYLYETPEEAPDRFLSDEILLLSSEPVGLQDLFGAARLVAQENGFDVTTTADPVPAGGVRYSPKEHSARFVFNSLEDRERLWEPLSQLVDRFSHEGKRVYLSRGTYAASQCLDLTPTNKHIALERFAARIGVSSDRILRIGDQGQEGGNDYDLLNSPAGFSVAEVSSNLEACYPVLADELTDALSGADATDQLLRLVLLFPSLSIVPAGFDHCRAALAPFHRRAVSRAREEAEIATARIRVRLRQLLPPNGSADERSPALRVDDLFDPLSGGVRLRDWEADDISTAHPGYELFELHRFGTGQPPDASRAMYTDTGILLRGPSYYFGLTREQDNASLPEYLTLSEAFLANSLHTIEHLASEPAALVRYKLALGILDNVRSMLIDLAYVAFATESADSDPTYALTRQLYGGGVIPHTEHHAGFLLDSDQEWELGLRSYAELLQGLQVLLASTKKPLLATLSRRDLASLDLFKWRESDDFLSNVTAAQLGLVELRKREDVRGAEPLLAVGLAYGGTELPAVAAAVAARRGFQVETGLAKISVYSDMEMGDKVRAGELDHVHAVLRQKRRVCTMDAGLTLGAGPKCVLLDDNCTTGITLQLARDVVVALGGDVVGAIIVRFPGPNRYTHMAKAGHGFPDPDVLFSFIRGLVAASPYTRLLAADPADDKGYRDASGIFDKAKARILRYLAKNGTSVVKRTA